MADARRRIYRTFVHREAALRICCEKFDVVAAEVVHQRQILGDYIRRQPEFQSSLTPLELLADAPPIARRMARAAWLAGVGPMAAVAGAVAQCAAEAALAAGADEAIVDNGGDIFLKAVEPVVIRLGTGTASLGDRLAFLLEPGATPIAVCSSSGKMGHSFSFGRCDLATIVAQDGALADAVATQAGNLIRTADEVDPALERIVQIPGVDGVLLVKDDRIGLAGRLPQLIKTHP